MTSPLVTTSFPFLLPLGPSHCLEDISLVINSMQDCVFAFQPILSLSQCGFQFSSRLLVPGLASLLYYTLLLLIFALSIHASKRAEYRIPGSLLLPLDIIIFHFHGHFDAKIVQ